MTNTVVEEVRVLAYLHMVRKSGRNRHIREAAGLSQLDLGRAVGVPQTTISSWECGHKPRGEAAIRYGEALMALDSQAEQGAFGTRALA